MKTTGAMWKQYMDSWPEGQWFDDSDEHVNGVLLRDIETPPKDNDIVEFTCGVVFATERDDTGGKSLVRHFAAWKKSLTYDFFTCTVPKASVEQFKVAMAALGCKFTAN